MCNQRFIGNVQVNVLESEVSCIGKYNVKIHYIRAAMRRMV